MGDYSESLIILIDDVNKDSRMAFSPFADDGTMWKRRRYVEFITRKV